MTRLLSINHYFQSEKVVIVNMQGATVEYYKELLFCYLDAPYVRMNDISVIDPLDNTHFLPNNRLYLGIDIMNELKKPEYIIILRH